MSKTSKAHRKRSRIFGVIQAEIDDPLEVVLSFMYHDERVTAELVISRRIYIELKKFDRSLDNGSRPVGGLWGLPFGWQDYIEGLEESLIRFLDENGLESVDKGTEFAPTFMLKVKGSPDQIVEAALRTVYRIRQLDEGLNKGGKLPIPPSVRRSLTTLRKQVLTTAQLGIDRMRKDEGKQRTVSTSDEATRKRIYRAKQKKQTKSDNDGQ